jgi:hypothetical protein
MCDNENVYELDNSLPKDNVKLEGLPQPIAVFSKMEHKFPLKYPNQKREIISIIGIPTMKECRIFSQGGKPVLISEIAAKHYGVSSLVELVEKPAMIFRRFRDEHNNYEEPWRWHTHRVTIKSFTSLGRFDMATVTTKDKNDLIEEILIHRICIDWEYKD